MYARSLGVVIMADAEMTGIFNRLFATHDGNRDIATLVAGLEQGSVFSMKDTTVVDPSLPSLAELDGHQEEELLTNVSLFC